MSYFERDNARIYYEEFGKGEPIIALHGLIANTLYWSLPGVAKALAAHFRLISMEMRGGHGRTVVEGDPKGFDDETMGEDLIALADHLKLDRFHVLGHSTGGMIAVRYAMKDCSRFTTMVLTDTGSFTSFLPSNPETTRLANDNFAKNFEKFTWDQIIGSVKKVPNPFFRGIAESERCDEMLRISREMVELGDRNVIASFIRSFYTDPDPRTDGLHKIQCPVLIIYGEKDDLFIQSSKLMAKEIPGAEITEYPRVGHMTAIEAPERLAADIIGFIKRHPIS
jgi:pimeloyl-ACP methyl ester carboxylesterase